MSCIRGRCNFSHDFFDTHNRVVLKAAEPGLETQDMFVLQRILFMNNTFLFPEVSMKYEWSHNCFFVFYTEIEICEIDKW